MKKTFAKLTSLAIVVVIATGALSTISSCSKTNPNAAFIGTFAGNTTSNNNSNPDTVVVSAGNSSTAVTLLERKSGVVLTGTVAGTTLTIPSQNVSIAGGTYPVSGSGGLSGNTLTVSSTATIVGVQATSVFTGTKQ